jgi:hypothetical protein
VLSLGVGVAEAEPAAITADDADDAGAAEAAKQGTAAVPRQAAAITVAMAGLVTRPVM